MPKADMLIFGGSGMDSSVDPRKLSPEQYAKGINVSLTKKVIGTRFAIRVHELTGDDVSDLNFQGACFYNPSRGQSATAQGSDFSSIAFSAGGRTFIVIPSENFRVSDITGKCVRNASHPIASLFQAENYLIVQQPTNNTLIYDGEGKSRWSDGINDTNRDASELCNAAGAGVYAHGRIHQVVAGRRIFVGDIIHQSNGTNAENVLGMTDQVYWASGAWFAPPSDWDEIVAAAVLPTQNTNHGHGEVMFHSPSGVLSLRTNVYPRTSWLDQEMVKHAIIGAGAMGPYALAAIIDGDQIFRSRFGIQSLRSAATQGRSFGGPIRSLGSEVDVWLGRDDLRLLRYCSMAKLDRQNKLFCTTSPVESGVRWYHRGLVSLHLLPSQTQDSGSAWEGLITFPEEAAYPILMVNGNFGHEQRLFVFCYGKDGKLRLAEIMGEEGNDMVGCQERSIPCRIITGQFHAQSPTTRKDFNSMTPVFSNVRGDFRWGVFTRTDLHPEWVQIGGGEAEVADSCQRDPFSAWHGASINDTHAIPATNRVGRWVQAMVAWSGVADLDGLRVDYTTFDSELDKSKFGKACITEPHVICDGDFDHQL